MNISLIIIITILVFVPIQQLDIRRKLLIYLVLVLLALQNIEGFGTGIDGEALRNIASLYNNADGTLKVKNIHASGDIKVDGKIESDGPTIGSVLLAKAPANWSNGESHLNKYPGGTVYLGGATGSGGVVNGIISWNGPPVKGSGNSNKNMIHIHSGWYNPSTTTQYKNVLYQNEDIQVKNITANGDITATGDIKGKNITATGKITSPRVDTARLNSTGGELALQPDYPSGIRVWSQINLNTNQLWNKNYASGGRYIPSNYFTQE